MPKINLNSNLVSVKWLQKHINAENLIILNATIPKVTSSDSNSIEIKIPKATFFDIKNKFSNTKASFPNTIPSTEAFETAVQHLGINKDAVIVVYDEEGIYSSARTWWLFKTFGFKKIAVLNGGLPEWIAKGFKTESKNSTINNNIIKGNFKAIFNVNNLVVFNDLNRICKDENYKVIDARSSDRFNCKVAEPRKGLRSGTIPNSINLPYNNVLNKTLLKPSTELKLIFNELANKKQHLVFSCGSGITASILSLAATIAGYTNSVYDGSWTEYVTLTDKGFF